MNAREKGGVGALLLAAAVAVAPLQGQQTIGAGVDFLGYSFDEGLGADAAQLMLVPVALRLPIGRSFVLDVYSAWAQGRVEQGDTEFNLSGPVDTRVKATIQATPWALLSFGASLPTGNSSHDSEEAVVAAVLATDLLGFREATWGTGLALTSSVATAVRAGNFGIGLAGSYSVRDEFEPLADDDLTYQPGNETRVRIGIDRNIGSNTFTAGATFMRYDQDQANGRNLFQAGNRLRFDASYAFRAGAGVWTLYAADLYRENGDLTLRFVDQAGAELSDSTVTTAKQNLVVAGLIGSIGLGAYVFRPNIDVRYQTREESDGRDEGSGWIVGAGGDFPIRLFGGYDFFPKARVLWGSINDADGTARNVMGAEFSGTLRWSF